MNARIDNVASAQVTGGPGLGPTNYSSGIPIFLQKWWLNTVGNAVSVQEAQSFEVGEVIGSLSYIEHFNKAGILFGGNLPWTTLGGQSLLRI